MSKISADNISNKLDTKEIPTDTVIAGSAKAWVNFNGTGVVAINDHFNVSSITDNGAGDYTINFTNAMNDANYSAVFSAANVSNGTTVSETGVTTASSVRIACINTVSSVVDPSRVSSAIFAN